MSVVWGDFLNLAEHATEAMFYDVDERCTQLGSECGTVYDLVIRDAQIVDGTGSLAQKGDVAVKAGRIARRAERIDGDGQVEVSGAGRVLSPGFIDVHSHDDFAALQTPQLPWKAAQGVTTEIVGNCGIGVAPFPGAEDWFQKLHPGVPAPKHRDYGGYFRPLEQEPPSLTLAVLAGHGAVRRAAAPDARRPLDARETQRALRFLDEALDAGVVGLSLGLIYDPGVFASREELLLVSRRIQGRAPLLTVHLRSEADNLLLAVTEAIEVASETGVGLQLSHHKAQGRNNWGKVNESLRLIEEARASGLDVWVDQYPYTAGSTVLSAVMERGGLRGGVALGELHAEDIVIASTSADARWEGQSLAELAQLWGCDPEQAAERVLESDPGVWVVVHAMSEDDVRRVLADPHTLIGSDGLPTAGETSPTIEDAVVPRL